MCDRSKKDTQAALEEKLGYRFAYPALLTEALTHSSYANEHGLVCNERLEFLGDAVFQITVSRYLYEKYPKASEGELSRYRQNLVCNETLAVLARKIGLEAFLLLGRGIEKKSMRAMDAILANTMEAIAGAIFLDAGARPDKRVADTLMRLLAPVLSGCQKYRSGDYKTRLQQLVEQDGSEQLAYRVVSCTGPAHDPVFSVQAMLNSNIIGNGYGHSKQEAEENAAKEALVLFGDPDICDSEDVGFP